jgi:hypothetical protein
VLEFQFQHVKGNDLGEFKELSSQAVVMPLRYSSGSVIYPFAMAK